MRTDEVCLVSQGVAPARALLRSDPARSGPRRRRSLSRLHEEGGAEIHRRRYPPCLYVLDADAWAKEHSPALRLVFEAFEVAGEWPFLKEVQRALIHEGKTWNLVVELGAMLPIR